MTALTVRRHVGASVVAVHVAGNLQAGNVYLLSRTVAYCLRCYAKPVLELDLTGVLEVDSAGLDTILDCRRRAEHRGVMFRIIGVSAALRVMLMRLGVQTAAPQRPPPRPPRTGTVCPSGLP